MRPTARSLALDLLSTLGAGTMPVRALIAAGELFRIDGNAMRVAVTRLVAEGMVQSDERGEYKLGPAASTISTQVTGWRSLEERIRKWEGGWVGAAVAGVPRAERARVRSGERALRLLGFRWLAPGLALRPDNLAGGIAATRERLAALGLDERAPVFEVRQLDAERDVQARALWDSEQLPKRYRSMIDKLAGSARRLESLPEPKAMAESFLIGGEAIRTLVLDPLLPEPIAPVSERKRLLDSMREYDRLGRRCWAGFMRSHGALQQRAPHHMRAIDAPALAATFGANP